MRALKLVYLLGVVTAARAKPQAAQAAIEALKVTVSILAPALNRGRPSLLLKSLAWRAMSRVRVTGVWQ
ncbi:hypothetical protein [Streptomyces subrutilus]|uniref:hypothetical protein n=1 Tax=Streptomyces subrutilus TaxID=36818 RepID=UPI0034099AE3